MAEPLKNQFGPEIPCKIAAAIHAVHPVFDSQAFVAEVLEGYLPLDLMARGRKVAHALRNHLPHDYAQAAEILIASLGPTMEASEGWGMAPFLYLPHSFFFAEFGLENFEVSMRAQYELTQRFTAEFSIRPYLEKHRDATLALLKRWAHDPNVHVRRLVSEGTRPRLPWAPRLRDFQADPGPVLELLELLKDDAELYVRRSVANSLNDIGKDHPEKLHQVARRWLKNASKERVWLVKHALRSAVKRGDPAALQVLGFGRKPEVRLACESVSPQQVRLGESVKVSFELSNTTRQQQSLLVDLRVFFVKASGRTSAKVFKLKTLQLEPGEKIRLEKNISLVVMTTRRLYPGEHRVEALLNGIAVPLGAFELLAGEVS